MTLLFTKGSFFLAKFGFWAEDLPRMEGDWCMSHIYISGVCILWTLLREVGYGIGSIALNKFSDPKSRSGHDTVL